MNTRAAAKAQTRANILAAAKELFLAHGYEGATLRDITEKAQLSTGAFFSNFADKEALFEELTRLDPDIRRLRLEGVIEELGRIGKHSPLSDALLSVAVHLGSFVEP